VLDFPFVAELPKRQKSRLVTLWDSWTEFKALTNEHGSLVPASLAAKLGGVCKQRIFQLCELGKLRRIDFHGHVYITEESFVSWAKSERKGGRPLNIPTTASDAWKLAKDSSK